LAGIIDVHVHLSERKDDELVEYARRNGLAYSLVELRRLMHRNRVERGLLLSPPVKEGRPLPNKTVLELCARSDGILSPVLTVEPTTRDVVDATKLAEATDVKAFKIRLGYMRAGARDAIFDKLYDYAESNGIPVMFHTGDTASSKGDLSLSHPLNLDGLANLREDLVIVVCHFGNPWFEDTAELIYKHPNVYADISGLVTGGSAYASKYLEWLAAKISHAVYFAGGADKILFGTDYPVTTYADTLRLVRKLAIRREDKEKILSRNARRVFGL
jgi:hypothetical protein